MDRKKFLLGLGALGAAPFLSNATNKISPTAKRVLRIAHITDCHVEQNDFAISSMNKLYEYINHLPDKPDFIMNTGDCVMDALGKSRAKVTDEWRVWHAVQKNNQLPMYNAIGNHDVWGWSNPLVTKNMKGFGKAWAVEELKLSNRYYSFTKNNWHFVVLDSTHNLPTWGYTAKLDDEQFEWLAAELKNCPAEKNICILSHIPILSSTVFFDGNLMKNNKWQIPGAWMHKDAKRLKDLFFKHKNVKLALSGHVHLQDEVNYLGVKYLCNGAASGGWWGGNYQEFPPAFALVDLYEDGSSKHQIINYLTV